MKESEAVATTRQQKLIPLDPTSISVLLAQNISIRLSDGKNLKGRQNESYTGPERQSATFEEQEEYRSLQYHEVQDQEELIIPGL